MLKTQALEILNNRERAEATSIAKVKCDLSNLLRVFFDDALQFDAALDDVFVKVRSRILQKSYHCLNSLSSLTEFCPCKRIRSIVEQDRPLVC
jgi:hypothetical protein